MEPLPYKVFTNREQLAKKNIKIKPKASILMSFYNNPRFFDLVLPSIEQQNFKDFEWIICDDGSRPEVVEHIQNKIKNANVLIQHLWQPDVGARKPEILNKALVMSQSDYIILIDQDCVLHPEFVKEHYENRKEKTALSGRRLELSPFLTDMLTPEKIENHFLQKNLWWMIPLIAHRRHADGTKGIYIKNTFLRKILNRKNRPIVGSNYSVHKKDLMAINGFDMRYTVIGMAEDSEVEYRLTLDGVRVAPVCNMAIQYHLFHRLRPRDDRFVPLFEKTIKEKIKITPCGVDLIAPASIINL